MTNDATNNPAPEQPDAGELLDTLVITGQTNRASAPGTWVSGTIAGHRFEALVFRDPSGFGIDNGCMSKLWLRHEATKQVVASFDRGWDTSPANLTAAQIVGLLADGLSEHVFGG